jgi:DNA replication initiation complex subunit (GINS family)
MEDSIVISYETLFELLRLERSRTELQNLPADFIEDSLKLIEDSRPGPGLLESEIKQRDTQTRNMIRILNEIYDRREKKIMNMAIDKSRTKSAIIDFGAFLRNERELFDRILAILNSDREKYTLKPDGKPKNAQIKNEVDTAEKSGQEERNADQEVMETDDENNLQKKTHKTIRFLHAMPVFLGPDMEEFGPFLEEYVARLPARIANILIDKKRAEEISLYN